MTPPFQKVTAVCFYSPGPGQPVAGLSSIRASVMNRDIQLELRFNFEN